MRRAGTLLGHHCAHHLFGVHFVALGHGHVPQIAVHGAVGAVAHHHGLARTGNDDDTADLTTEDGPHLRSGHASDVQAVVLDHDAAQHRMGLLAEPAGVVPKPSNWSGPTRSNLAIGQGLSVTALQITTAYSAIANGGLLMQPKLIKALEFPSGEKIELDPVALRQVLSERCVNELTQMMRSVVEEGTGKQARVKGVAIAGKTGTAQKVDLEAKSYYTNRYVSSFAGFFPADRPMYTLLVMVDDPRGQGYYGGQIAAPVFGAIAQEILEERHSYRPPKDSATGKADPDSSQSEPKSDSTQQEKFVYDTLRYLDVPLVQVPDVVGLPLRVAAVRMQNAGFETELVGYGIVASQTPPAGEKVPASFVCKVIAEPVSAAHYAVSR